jgi:anion-transporting  ArsA/GET3 family ATPase
VAQSPPGGVLDALLQRRLLFVAGKGGTGKSTIAAALALLAARAGKRVLCIEVDAKGSLAFALGAEPVPFQPRMVQKNISVLALHPEEALTEYLRVYFKVPRLARLTPLARVMDFVATGVPGTKDVLVIGKIAYEEKRVLGDRPAWDLILVDAEATGHVLPQLNAARSMLELAKGGIIRAQVEWIDVMLADPRRTALTICALPEEMPVVEAIELHDRARDETRIALGACFLNRVFSVPLTVEQIQPLERAAAPARREEATARLGGDPAVLLEGVEVARRLFEASTEAADRLREAMSCPVVEVPVQAGARPGLATTRLVAGALAAGAE